MAKWWPSLTCKACMTCSFPRFKVLSVVGALRIDLATPSFRHVNACSFPPNDTKTAHSTSSQKYRNLPFPEHVLAPPYLLLHHLTVTHIYLPLLDHQEAFSLVRVCIATRVPMAPQVQVAKATLSIPLYACDFDPKDSGRLVVGGGGGAGRSGVGNKIVRRASIGHATKSNANILL